MLQLKIRWGGGGRSTIVKMYCKKYYKMFELTTHSLNTDLHVLNGIIDGALQHRKRSSVNFTHYIRLQVLKSRRHS